ncbi:MAG: hypothetical protein ACO3A2_04040 [Bdellovibrionia bacterium]
MNRFQKLELLQRSLALKHKLKVFESQILPDNHEDLSIVLITKWELEDELKAIEEILAESRRTTVAAKRMAIEKASRHFERESKKELTQ